MSLEIEGLCVEIGRRIILKDLEVCVKDREVFGILGRSGSGKTTLLRAIVGLAAPCAGSIRLFGEEVGGIEPAARGVAFMHQSLALFEDLTVEGNVGFGDHNWRRRFWGEGRKETAQAHEETGRSGELLSLLCQDLGLEQYRKVLADRLSGGERQRVALARALGAGRRVLLLDEPLSQLDLAVRGRSRALMRRLFERYRCTVLLVSHDIQDCIDLCDRVGVLSEGRLIEVGKPGQLVRAPRFLETAILTGDINVLRLTGSPLETGVEFSGRAINDLEVHGSFEERGTVSVPKFWAVRPFGLSLRQQDGWSFLTKGKVVRRVDTGEGYLIFVELCGGESFRIKSNAPGTEPNSTVQLYYDSKQARFLQSLGEDYV